MRDFIHRDLFPGDSLTVVTPIKTYRLRSDSFSSLSKFKAINQLVKILRKDIVLGNTEYWSAVRYLTGLVRAIQGDPSGREDQIPSSDFEDMPLDEMVNTYRIFLEIIESLRDVDKVKQAYSDSCIAIHFLFFPRPPKYVRGLRFEEHSEDIYTAFTEMANATGRITLSSANPVVLFKRAINASENYYLLYYSPSGYMRDGKFRNIEVKVKNRNYRIVHRAGYVAN